MRGARLECQRWRGLAASLAETYRITSSIPTCLSDPAFGPNLPVLRLIAKALLNRVPSYKGNQMLKDELLKTNVEKGTVRAWWLGGTGFIFKAPAGTQIYIDPYLSDSVAAIFGQPRGFPPPIALEDVRPDLVIATHLHEDHLDPGGIPTIARVSHATFMCPPTAYSRALG